MPYQIRDGKAVCLLCGASVENRSVPKAEHQRECIDRRRGR